MINAFACENSQLQRLTEAASTDVLGQAVWIDMLNATPDEIDRVQLATGMKIPSRDDVSEIESSSRLANRNGALYLSMPLIQFAEDGPRGVSAGFVLSPHRLITIRFAP